MVSNRFTEGGTMALNKEKEHSGKRRKGSDSGRMGKRVTKADVKRSRRRLEKAIVKKELSGI